MDVVCARGHARRIVARYIDRGRDLHWTDGASAPALSFPHRWQLDLELQLPGGRRTASGLRADYGKPRPERARRLSRPVVIDGREFHLLVCSCSEDYVLLPVEVKDAAITAVQARGESVVLLDEVATYPR